MQDGIYVATYTNDQGRHFGQLDVEGEALHFTSWVKHYKHSEYPQRGRVASRSRVWVMQGDYQEKLF